MKLLIALCLILSAQHSFARSIVKVSHVGSSSKGQFVAFEEFGFSDDKIPFSRIRVFNAWKNKYVSREFKATGVNAKESLESIRDKVKKLAIRELKTFNISV